MPRNPNNSNQFIAGQLPQIKFKGKKYFVDGRSKQVRNVENHNDQLDVCYDENIWNNLTGQAKNIIKYEFHGVK